MRATSPYVLCALTRSIIFLACIVSGTCDTRETVLKRDGTNVVTDSSCKATSGNWVSPYDGVATTLASDLDIVSHNTNIHTSAY